MRHLDLVIARELEEEERRSIFITEKAWFEMGLEERGMMKMIIL